MRTFFFVIFCVFGAMNLCATEYHVSVSGKDSSPGTLSKPFQTISEAVKHAMPGDTVTVHEGTYREWVDPLREVKMRLPGFCTGLQQMKKLKLKAQR